MEKPKRSITEAFRTNDTMAGFFAETDDILNERQEYYLLEERIEKWKRVIRIWKKKPLFGKIRNKRLLPLR